MVEIEEETEELLNETEKRNFTGEEIEPGEEGKVQNKSKKNKASQSQEVRKRKQDALDGNDPKKATGESEGKAKGAAKTSDANKGKMEGEKPKPESGDKEKSDSGEKLKGEGSGSQSLQSGQTTVQFSSGGNAGMAGSLTALLSLFGSSATLARVDVGNLLGISTQASNLNLRAALNTSTTSSLIVVSENNKVVTGINTAATDRIIEGMSPRIITDITFTKPLNNNTIIHDTTISGLRGFGPQTDIITRELPKINIIIDRGGSTFIETFNIGTFFFPLDIRFVFTTGTTPYTNMVDNYFTSAGFSPLTTYRYEVIQPNSTISSPTTQDFGIQVKTLNSPLSFEVTAAPSSGPYFGLTLTESGDIYASTDILRPMSVLLNVTDLTGTSNFPVRINAGPGREVASHLDPNLWYAATGDILQGDRGTDGYTGAYKSSVIKGSGQEIIIGNSYQPQITPGNIEYNRGMNAADASLLMSSFGTDLDHYEFPSSTIFRHTGDSATTVPTAATYGNFASFFNLDFQTTTNPTLDLTNPGIITHYSLGLGGNVLDVFGTKYGVGDVFDVKIGTIGSDITMGGNTLAGFGTSYGDLQTLHLITPIADHTSNAVTTYTFRSNVLWVDKSIGSELFPHLENLHIDKNFTNDSSIKLVFNDSFIHGNIGNDIFYGDIYNVGDAGNDNLYNGFLEGVKVVDDGNTVTVIPTIKIITPGQGNQPDVITFDEGTNSITWGKNTYTGGQDPAHPSPDKDIYHFTLLGDMDAKPVMQGHATITDFNSSADTLVFQITEALFRSLDFSHTKQITFLDLNQEITPDSADARKLIFSGGGSLTLHGATPLDLNDGNVKFEVNMTYKAVENQTPTIEGPPYVYGGPFAVYKPHPQLTLPSSLSPYFNELDNFFKNSLFATYTVSNDTPLPVGVTIDQWGTITVGNTTPFLGFLTITATTNDKDDATPPDTATNSFLFAMLEAPIIDSMLMPAQGGGNEAVGFGIDNTSVILRGSSEITTLETLLGTNLPTLDIQTINNLPKVYKGNLLVDTQGGITNAYGSFQHIIAEAIATGSNNPGPDIIDAYNVTVKLNALYINGTAYGTAGDMTLHAQGGSVDVDIAASPITINSYGQYTHSPFSFAPTENGLQQTIYGKGTLYGIMDTFTITSEAGTIGTVTTSAQTDISQIVGSKIDLRGIVEDNTFNFGPTTITIHGDTAGDINTVYGNVYKLDISVINQYTKVESSNIDVKTTASFTNNHFNFSDATLTGGVGTTHYYGHLHEFGDPFAYPSYNGFVKGATVSIVDRVITLIDQNGTPDDDSDDNTLTWGNTHYIGGDGPDIYHFTLIQDANGRIVMQGFDTIENFNPSIDKLVFHVESNLNAVLNFDMLLNSTHIDYSVNPNGPTITFNGGGEIYLPNANLSNSNITPDELFVLQTLYQTSIEFQVVGSAPSTLIKNPTPGFDPVFVNVVQPFAFAQFLSGANPFKATYTTTAEFPNVGGGDNETANIITLDPNGTLTINLAPNSPFAGYIDVTATSEYGESITFSTPFLAINAEDGYIHRDTGNTVIGTAKSEAFETQTAGNTIIGDVDSGGIDGTSDTSLEFNSDTSPTTDTEITFNSNLIADMTDGGHTAVGNIEHISFLNIGANPNATSLDGQKIIFNSNAFNVRAFDSAQTVDAQTGGVYGNIIDLTMTTNGSLDQDGVTTLNTTINSNEFTFSSNTIFGNGALYGNMKTLSLTITDLSVDPDPDLDPLTKTTIGNAHIDSNIFTFAPNEITSIAYNGSDPSTIYTSIGTLVLYNSETATYVHNLGTDADPISPSSIANNQFIFGDSTLRATTGNTHFYGDIADLSNTKFVLRPVSFTLIDVEGSTHIQVQDVDGNVITWGNNLYTSTSNGLFGNTYTFTLIATEDGKAVMQGDAIIENAGSSTLDFNLAPELFRLINTDHDRTLTTSEIANAFSTTLTPTDPTIISGVNSGTITFSGAGSIQLINANGNTVTAQLAYTEAPITVANNKPDPIVFVSEGGITIDGTYDNEVPITTGNILDTYFDHVDIANTGSVYTVEFSDKFPQLALAFGSLLSGTGTNAIFDNYGTADSSQFTSPFLGIITVTPTDVHFATNVADNDVHVDLMVGAFNGTMTNDETSGGTFYGKNLSSSYLQGEFSNETLVGNVTANNNSVLLINPDTSVNTYFGVNYGTDHFGGNLIINTTTGNTAYGDFENINFNIQTSTAYDDPIPNFNNATFDFGSNAFYVNGTVYGISDELYIKAQNALSGEAPTQLDIFNIAEGNFPLKVNNNTWDFGQQIIFGEGTFFGHLNTLHIDVLGNTTATTANDFRQDVVDVTTEFKNNTFDFDPTQIIILGDGHSSIYTHLNSLVTNVVQGTAQPGQASDSIDSSVDFSGNKYLFNDSIAVAGIGGADFYSDVNDMSSTPFWNSAVYASDDGHIDIKDINNNEIKWGNNDFYLSTESASQPAGIDTLHINLLLSSDGQIIMPGKLEVYHFDPTVDYINLNLSTALYNAIHNSINNNAFITGAVLDTFKVGQINAITITTVITVGDPTPTTIIDFGYGSIDFVGTSFSSFASLGSHLKIGTTFVGTTDVDAFTFSTNSTEFNHITQFNTGATNTDSLSILVPVSEYNTLSHYGQLSYSEVLSSLAGGATTNLSITHSTSTAFAQADPSLPTSDVDTIINFQTGGSLTLHNANITEADLGNYLGLTQQGADNVEDTFYFIIPENGLNDVSSFTQNANITNFDHPEDNLQLIFSKEVFDALSNNSTLSGSALANFIEDNTNTNVGGIAVSNPAGTNNTKLTFTVDNNAYGSITLLNSSFNDLSDIDNGHLQIGSLQAGTNSTDTFQYVVADATSTNFDFFTYYHHITDYATGTDKLVITLPESVYNLVSQNGTLAHDSLLNALDNIVDAPTGGMLLNHTTAQYSGAINTDTIIEFVTKPGGGPNDPIDIHGSITLHNVDIQNFSDFGANLQLGAFRTGTSSSDTFDYSINGSISSFDRIDHIVNFNTTDDYLHLYLPKAVYDAAAIDQGVYVDHAQLLNNLEANALTSSGGITVSTTNNALYDGAINHDSTVEFKANGADPYGSITLHNVNLNDDLSSLGDHLKLGYLQYGTVDTTDTFNFTVPSGSGDSFNQFHQFSKIIDFNTEGNSLDNVQIHLSDTLYDSINAAHGNDGVSVADLEASTSSSLGGIHIEITGGNTIINFMANNVVYGSVTLQGVTNFDTSHLLVAHP
ncbi:MAG: hypothetical protein FJX71_03650 [Alphaproteobacteria bacterium]|nr:hypothetical protein [Alphaproteobacteria bacterium]